MAAYLLHKNGGTDAQACAFIQRSCQRGHQAGCALFEKQCSVDGGRQLP
jgi:hypothetical protein